MRKYVATLIIAVVPVTYAASFLTFATRSQVAAGTAVDETVDIEFTIDADDSHTYTIDSTIAQFLTTHIRFESEGSAHVVDATVVVTPKDVSWSEGKSRVTSPGAGLSARLRWDTPSTAADGAHGSVYLDFPDVPDLEGQAPTFHSGGYHKSDRGRYLIREVTTYQSAYRLTLARFGIALAGGLPFGLLLHTIFWALILKREKRSRLAALPPPTTVLPQTFYSSPTEWTAWLGTFGIGSFVASVIAVAMAYDGFMSSYVTSFIYGVLGIAIALGLIVAYYARTTALTVSVDTDGIHYARGRGDLQWTHAAWNDILRITQKSRTYRGVTSRWMEIEFNDKRKRLNIGKTIEGYPALRDILVSRVGDEEK